MATQKEVAEQIGVTAKTIQNWSKMPGFPLKPGRGGYDAIEILKWRVRVLQAENKTLKNGEFGEFESGNETENKKLERLQEYAKLEERRIRIRINKHKLSVAEKIFAPVLIIEQIAERLAVPLAVTLGALPSKIKTVWQDIPPEAEKLIDTEIASAQNELSNVTVDLSDYQEGYPESDSEWLDGIEESDTTDRT